MENNVVSPPVSELPQTPPQPAVPQPAAENLQPPPTSPPPVQPPSQSQLPPQPPQKNRSPWIIGVGVLLLLLLGLAAWAYSSGKNTPEPQVIPQTDELSEIEDTSPNSNECEIAWLDPIFPEEKTVDPLFLRETERVFGTGYEGIIRRTLDTDEDGTYIAVDLVTNMLPNENSPYYLYALAVNDQGIVCSGSNLGPLEQIPDVGVWTAGPFYLPVENVNDAQVFAITEKGFGAAESDRITSIYDSEIILVGAYSQNRDVEVIEVQDSL